MVNGLRRYFVESWSELKKVAWPTREMVVRLTLIVIAVSVAVGAYISSSTCCSTPRSTGRCL